MSATSLPMVRTPLISAWGVDAPFTPSKNTSKWPLRVSR